MNVQGISWPESNEVWPVAQNCDTPECAEPHSTTVAIRVVDVLVVHRRLPGFVTACGKTFDALSLNNFEMKR